MPAVHPQPQMFFSRSTIPDPAERQALAGGLIQERQLAGGARECSVCNKRSHETLSYMPFQVQSVIQDSRAAEQTTRGRERD